MKNRIIALLLSLSVLFGSFSLFPKRANAAAPAIGVGVFALAWQIIGIMTGRYDDAAEAIRYDIENGWDGLTNPDSAFQQDWQMGWDIICNTVQDWINLDKVTTNGDVIKITYDQYMELYGQVISVMAAPSIEFDCGFDYMFLAADLTSPIYYNQLPTLDIFFNYGGESYAPVYFNENMLVLGGCFCFYSPGWAADRIIQDEDFHFGDGFTFGGDLTKFPASFSFLSPSVFYSPYYDREVPIPYCFVFSNGHLSMVPSSDVDVTGMTSGLITTTGDYPAFIKSITSADIITGSVAGALNDLKNILPTAKNPSLSIPLNPDLDVPLEDQIVVGDIECEVDKPLSDYLVEDFEIPEAANSELLTKFPFCIPYDFVRFLGVFAADPIPPVFHIPISTSPQNLAQWADNETLGQYVSPNDPMFEIDEEIVLDFAHIPLVQPVCYTVFIVGFVFLLLHITTKFIQH